MRNPTEGGVDDTSYIFANGRLERTKEAARYRPINNGRIKSPENQYRNRRERLLTPNFLFCEHCFWWHRKFVVLGLISGPSVQSVVTKW